MRGDSLGEFEEIVLLSVLVLGEEASGYAIKKEINQNTGRGISRGALHTSLSRLETKGYVSSRQGEANKARRGRPKRYYEVTNHGKSALHAAKEMRDQLWDRIPDIRLKLQYG